jgi:hypothetical protein
MKDLDKKLFRKAINYLLDGFTLEIGTVKLRYYRKDDIVESEDWDVQVLDNGIFQAFLSSDRSGIYTKWMKVAELDAVDYFFKELNDTEKEELFISICASMAMSVPRDRG